jgi:outer membrane protein assembly factor BamB
VVNASPLVVADAVVGRAFITDYDGFGDAASIYCINTSPFNAGSNPYQPGDIVWQEPIGTASGSTPAYDSSVVYVASIAADAFGCTGQGYLTAFDIGAPPATRRLWSTCIGEGFFGGVCFSNGYLYAAGYNLNGSGDNSTLVKVSASDGVVIWTTPCERTSSIPIVVGDHIYLSAGINGFGSVPKVQAFRDDGVSAVKVWDTYVDTGGSLIIGGWTHEPLYADGLLYVGRIPLSGSFYGAYTDFYMLDVSRSPTDSQFIRDHRAGMGSSPALANGRLYTIGPSGLSAIARRGDCDGDGALTALDIQCFTNLLLSGASPVDALLMDFTLDSQLSVDDVPGFTAALLTP